MTNSIDLSWLIYPMHKQEFFDEYLEKKPLVIKRDMENYYEDLMTEKDVKAFLSSGNFPGVQDITLKHAGKKISPADYLTSRNTENVEWRTGVDMTKVVELFEKEKATIILHHCDKVWEPLRRLITAVNNDMLCGSGVNVFITPSHAQCFDAHYDENDLFIIQLSGSKRWKIFESYEELPLEPQNRKPVDFSNLKVLYDIHLMPGDILYVPRGFVHEVTTGDTLSLHITLGLMNITWSKVLTDYITELAFAEADYRKSFISSKFDTESGKDTVLKNIAAHISGHLTMDKLHLFANRYLKNTARSGSAIVENIFRQEEDLKLS